MIVQTANWNSDHINDPKRNITLDLIARSYETKFLAFLLHQKRLAWKYSSKLGDKLLSHLIQERVYNVLKMQWKSPVRTEKKCYEDLQPQDLQGVGSAPELLANFDSFLKYLHFSIDYWKSRI